MARTRYVGRTYSFASTTSSPTPTPTPGFDWTGVGAVIDTTQWATTFYQDRAGTTLVTASGQDVQSIRHPVLNTIIWRSPSAAPTNCWRLNIVSGVPYLEPKTTSGTDSILDYAYGASTQFINWGVALRVQSIINNGRILSPRTAGSAFYLYTYTGSPNGISFYNGGGQDYKDTSVAAGSTKVYDGYLGNGFTTPEAWARFRIGTTVQTLSDGSTPVPANPGAVAMDGIRLGGVSAGFGGFAGDVRIRALYFHQASNNADMLSTTRTNEINTWMQSLTL